MRIGDTVGLAIVPEVISGYGDHSRNAQRVRIFVEIYVEEGIGGRRTIDEDNVVAGIGDRDVQQVSCTRIRIVPYRYVDLRRTVRNRLGRKDIDGRSIQRQIAVFAGVVVQTGE